MQHYDAIMRYISQPPLLLDVHIHKPMLNARTWMDSLLAFFPGLQVGGAFHLPGLQVRGAHVRISWGLARVASVLAVLWPVFIGGFIGFC